MGAGGVGLDGLGKARSWVVVIWERICRRAASKLGGVGVLVTRARRAVVLAERGGNVVGGLYAAGAAARGGRSDVEVIGGGGADAGAVAIAGPGAEDS